ncbi:MAG: PadR family transcriptional regulator [Candidatus Aenigmatarchaeota archaeon]
MSVNKHNRNRQNDIEIGILQMQILWLLNKKPIHGYELMKRLNEIKTTKITQGTLYPTLQKLEKLKLIKSRKNERVIIYYVTSKGKKIMKETCDDFCRTFLGIIKDFVCLKCGAKIG